MGSAPYIGPNLGNGPIFEVSGSRLYYAKEHPGKLGGGGGGPTIHSGPSFAKVRYYNNVHVLQGVNAAALCPCGRNHK